MPNRAADGIVDQEPTVRRIRQAAANLFAERGFHGTGIRDLATAAGIRTSTLYHYMGTKEDLLVEIMIDAIAPLGRAAEQMLAEIDDPLVRLATLVEHHVWHHVRERQLTTIADTEIRALAGQHRERVLQARDSYEGIWRTTIYQGREAHLLAESQPDIATTALLQMATGVDWFSEGQTLTLTTLCRLYSDWALRLLQAGKKREELSISDPPAYLTAD
ncbi:TetR/AcrR family transcriptional regulator [Actinomadura madurae]|uniref:TetR/AcrR family transcriptional regulator n=1 Tax=Actinomadura madurae TaxID=1993 RepID=UPI003999E543